MEGAGDRVDVVESGSMHGAGPRFEATGSAETGCGANGSGARHASARLSRCSLAVCVGADGSWRTCGTTKARPGRWQQI